MGTKLTILAVSIGLFCGSLYGAYLHGRSTATAEIESEQARKHNKQWSELFALQGQLATRDLQLAEEQQKKAQIRTVKVIEKEVIYRDRIKNPDTAKCVADSGLFDLYNSAYGLSSDTKRPNGATSTIDAHRVTRASARGNKAQCKRVAWR